MQGLSRSGITISVGVLMGVEKEKAFKYSFLISIPTILVAALLDLGKIMVYQVDYKPVTIFLFSIPLSCFTTSSPTPLDTRGSRILRIPSILVDNTSLPSAL